MTAHAAVSVAASSIGMLVLARKQRKAASNLATECAREKRTKQEEKNPHLDRRSAENSVPVPV